MFIRIEASGAKAKFRGVPLFKKSKIQYIIGVVDEKDLDDEPLSHTGY